jgi:hypothetical protein
VKKRGVNIRVEENGVFFQPVFRSVYIYIFNSNSNSINYNLQFIIDYIYVHAYGHVYIYIYTGVDEIYLIDDHNHETMEFPEVTGMKTGINSDQKPPMACNNSRSQY